MCGALQKALDKLPEKGLIFGVDFGMCGDVRGMCGDVRGMCGALEKALDKLPEKGLIFGVDFGMCGDVRGMCGGCAGDVWVFFGRHLINSRKKWIMGCAGMCG